MPLRQRAVCADRCESGRNSCRPCTNAKIAARSREPRSARVDRVRQAFQERGFILLDDPSQIDFKLKSTKFPGYRCSCGNESCAMSHDSCKDNLNNCKACARVKRLASIQHPPEKSDARQTSAATKRRDYSANVKNGKNNHKSNLRRVNANGRSQSNQNRRTWRRIPRSTEQSDKEHSSFESNRSERARF